MEIKIAQGLASVPQARDIREEVFVREQGFQEEFDTIDHRAYHVLVYEGDRAVATGRTFPKSEAGEIWKLGRIAVRKDCRKLGLGAVVVAALEDTARRYGASVAELSAQIRVQGFYEKLGYRAEGESYLDEGCPHISMRRKL